MKEVRCSFLLPQGRALERMYDFLTFNKKVGVPSIVLNCEDTPVIRELSDHTIVLKGEMEELVTPLVYIAPLYLFSYHMAVKRGVRPERPPVPRDYRTADPLSENLACSGS